MLPPLGRATINRKTGDLLIQDDPFPHTNGRLDTTWVIDLSRPGESGDRPV
jgi:hypothetical protein